MNKVLASWFHFVTWKSTLTIASLNKQSLTWFLNYDVKNCFSFLVADTQLYNLPCWLVSNIFELRAVFALQLLPNRLWLSCRVSGLVFHETTCINLSFTNLTSLALANKKQRRIHGNPVANRWAGAVMRKPLGIQKCDLPTDTARC